MAGGIAAALGIDMEYTDLRVFEAVARHGSMKSSSSRTANGAVQRNGTGPCTRGRDRCSLVRAEQPRGRADRCRPTAVAL
jgi:hypothetical protein